MSISPATVSKQCGADENRVNKNLLPLLTALGAFLTNLPTLIRYFTTQTYLVKSDAA